ncbi:MAG: OmpA family protein [Thiobacillaceae bacterium]|jgi:outer membrane protein OmpA-like peptidoglycan-associated protein|nr:OmpA family protein [Thiobacillaceae bacterium]
MRKLPLALLMPLLFAGCASQDYVDGRATTLETQVAEIRARVQNQADQRAAERLAELERRTVEQQRLLAQYLDRMSGQEAALSRLQETGATTQTTLRDLAADAVRQAQAVEALRKALDDHSAQARRYEELIRAADLLASEASAKADEALARGAQTPPVAAGASVEADGASAREALRLANAALEQSRLALEQAQAAGERLDPSAAAALPAGRASAGEQAVPDAQGEARVTRIETAVSGQDGRIADLQGGLGESKRVARQALDLSESALALGRQNELRLKQSEALYSEVRDSLIAQQERLARNEAAIQEVSRTAQEALERALAAEKLAQGKLLYEVTLTEDDIRFPFDKADLAPGCCDRLQALAERLKADNRGVYLEIQGHTDSGGSTQYNMNLGQERAEAVRRYLHQQAGIPLHRMSAISYGESRPVADNASREGRKQNRRVVVVVLR